jgi:hypothetical protein
VGGCYVVFVLRRFGKLKITHDVTQARHRLVALAPEFSNADIRFRYVRNERLRRIAFHRSSA